MCGETATGSPKGTACTAHKWTLFVRFGWVLCRRRRVGARRLDAAALRDNVRSRKVANGRGRANRSHKAVACKYQTSRCSMPSLCEELLGGTVGGVIGMSVVYPLDTAKSRLQTTGRSRYSSTANVLTRMARKEGAMSLYRGLLSPVMGYGAMFAISFSSYGHAGRFLLRQRGASEHERLTLPEMGLAGAWAGLMNAPLRQVFERVKGVMQVRRGEKLQSPYAWSGACALDLVRREGVGMGLFRGMRATMLREPVQFAIYYPSYEVAKDYLLPPTERNSSRSRSAGTAVVPEPVLQMLAGGLAGCAIWLPPVYCLDVIKTRMQTAVPGVYGGVVDCLAKTVRAEGLPVMYRGLGAAMLRAFPMHGLVFLGYETTIDFLDARPKHLRTLESTSDTSTLEKQTIE